MPMPVAVVIVMLPLFIVFLFIVFSWSFPFDINSLLSFYIIRTATVYQDMHPWRCRQIAVDVDIYSGKWWKRWKRKTGIGLIETKG